MSEDRAMIKEPSGSVSNVNNERDVKTVAVSSELSPSRSFAMIEKTAKARMGETMGEM